MKVTIVEGRRGLCYSCDEAHVVDYEDGRHTVECMVSYCRPRAVVGVVRRCSSYRERGDAIVDKARPFYCASCGEEFTSRDGMYQDVKGLWQHDEEGGMSCCGPVLEKEK